MTSYADTGFLVKLYLQEPASPEAISIVARVAEPILLSPLTALELRNAFHLNVFQKKITEDIRLAAWADFTADLQSGLYAMNPLPNAELYEKAGDLADRYSATEGTRSLDLLHVAAALLLGAGRLLSFDARQRKIARAEGLAVEP